MKSYALFQRLVRRACANAHGERKTIARLLRHPSITDTHRLFLLQMIRIEVEMYKMSAHLNMARTKSLVKRTKAMRAALDIVKRPIPHESLAQTYLMKHLRRFVRDTHREVVAVSGLAGMHTVQASTQSSRRGTVAKTAVLSNA